MYSALWVAKTGLDAQQTKMSVISNNIANVNTNGYKKARAVFEDLLYQNVRQAGGLTTQDTQLPTGLTLGTGVRTVSTEKIHSQGNIVQTTNSLDVAIKGRGFFQVLLPSGDVGYSRDGSFQLDSQGQLVTSQGYVVQPAISVPANTRALTIGSDGVVSAVISGNSQPVQLGNMQLADFTNPSGLEAFGENVYVETTASGAAQIGVPGSGGVGSLTQGSLETSNVNVVEELVNMIETQRAYELNSKAITTTDQMLQFLTNNT